MTDLCPHDGDPQSCPPCQTALHEPETAGTSRVFVARFGSTCAGCGFDLRAGDPARFAGDRLHHAGCVDG